MKNCTWNSIFVDNRCEDCSQCPIKKYNCCTPNRADAEELIYRLDVEIQKFSSIRKKVLDKLGDQCYTNYRKRGNANGRIQMS